MTSNASRKAKPDFERTPAIYSILEFRKNEEGQRVAYHHVVAACSSEEAEAAYVDAVKDARMREADSSEFYIMTDEFRHMDMTPNVRQYVSGTERYREAGPEAIKDDDHRRWIEIQTKSYELDGELHRPMQRRFYFNRKRREAAANNAQDSHAHR